MELTPSNKRSSALPKLSELLEARGFQRSASGTFSNGRATVRLDECEFLATPGDGGKSWRADIREASPEVVAQLLGTVLAARSFLSQPELDDLEAHRRSAEVALASIAESIRENPFTHSGQQLRRFVWSLFNGHHSLNLWRLKDVLDSQNNAMVREVFSAWMEGHLSDKAIRAALVTSGEMDRWDLAKLGTRDRERLGEAVDAVNDLLRLSPPGPGHQSLTRSDELLRHLVDALTEASAPR